MIEEWIILVAQEVVGKSLFPHKKVGKFQRYKPWPYQSSSKPHRILYARRFIDSEQNAMRKAEEVSKEMFYTYAFGMDKTNITCVKEFTVTLHNITKNTTSQISTTIKDVKENQLFPGECVTNKRLGMWGIVKGL